MSIKNIHRNSFSDTPTTIKRKVDNNLHDIKKAYTKINGNLVLVWDITESKYFIIKLTKTSKQMKVTINTSDLLLMTTFPYKHLESGAIDWGDGSSTEINSTEYKYMHTYDDSITDTTITIKSNDTIVDFYKNFCNFENADAYIIIPNSITAIGSAKFSPSSSDDCYKNLVGVTIPESVVSIGASAFEGCSKLNRLILPSSITVCSEYMCKNCTSLTYVSAKNIKIISNDAFSGCSSLSNIELDNVIAIYNAFYGCSSLDSIKLPRTLQMLGNGSYAFYESTHNIYFDGTKSEWENISKGNFWSRNLNVAYTVYCTDGNIDYTIIH